MCTVSYIPVNKTIYLTSNRDEKKNRQPAHPPLVYGDNNSRLMYPKDGDKNGTWIAVNQRGHAAVLLNGAGKPHTSGKNYRCSRGQVVLGVVSSADPLQQFSNMEMRGIEPFTLVLYMPGGLYECRWNGTRKSVVALPPDKPHLWSSVTLYDDTTHEKRKGWFESWQKTNPVPGEEDIYQLHRNTGEGNPHHDYVMNRNNEICTVSITCLKIDAERAIMNYHALADREQYRNELWLSASPKASSPWFRKNVVTRIRHWEYWPFHVVYAPLYPYWLYLCLKARSFFFFSASNPSIRNGGFLMESKKDIYDLMPVGTYPVTTLVEKQPGQHFGIDSSKMSFPVIAKPDIGLRGKSVKLLKTEKDLDAYHQNSKVRYLLQEYIPYENEAGIFYCRFPGESHGKITGVVGKELLQVTGDGRQTIRELLQKDKRAQLQLQVLDDTDPFVLAQVLRNGETKVLVPYGNHSRGAKFIDLSWRANQQLTEVINNLCLRIPEFYFGRLDIRFNSWEDLYSGKNYSVIEVNGAGSEPAHMYDPAHSLLFAWKEIIRHWKILFRISRHNKQYNRASYLSLKEGLQLLRQNASYLKKIS